MPVCDCRARNLLDVPAEIIALIYRYRWAIEIFFRFFKHILGCRHLLSHSQNGIEIQTYCAIIACLLISLWTGRKPTLRTYEMICFYFCGLASEEELLAHIAKLKRQEEAAQKRLVELLGRVLPCVASPFMLRVPCLAGRLISCRP